MRRYIKLETSGKTTITQEMANLVFSKPKSINNELKKDSKKRKVRINKVVPRAGHCPHCGRIINDI